MRKRLFILIFPVIFILSFTEDKLNFKIMLSGNSYGNFSYYEEKEKFNDKGFFDFSTKSDFFYKNMILEVKNISTVGVSKQEPYGITSSYVELGGDMLNIGYKKSFAFNEYLGDKKKYGYPPLKEPATIFTTNDFAYIQKFGSKENTLETNGYTFLDTVYLNLNLPNIEFEYRTFETMKSTIKDVNGKYTPDRPTKYFVDKTLKSTIKIDDFKTGVYYIPGNMVNFFYKNVFSDVNKNGIWDDDQFKDEVTFAAEYKDFLINASIYNPAEKYFHMLYLQQKLKITPDEYVGSIEYDNLNKSISLFLTKNFATDFYANFAYQNEARPDYFFALATSYDMNALKPFGLISYKKDYKDRMGIGYNFGISLKNQDGNIDISYGNTQFRSVWDAWSFIPDNQINNVVDILFRYNFEILK